MAGSHVDSQSAKPGSFSSVEPASCTGVVADTKGFLTRRWNSGGRRVARLGELLDNPAGDFSSEVGAHRSPGENVLGEEVFESNFGLVICGRAAENVPSGLVSRIRHFGRARETKSSGTESEVSCRWVETQPGGAWSDDADSAVLEGRRWGTPRCYLSDGAARAWPHDVDGAAPGRAAGARTARGERAEAGFNIGSR